MLESRIGGFGLNEVTSENVDHNDEVKEEEEGVVSCIYEVGFHVRA